MIDLRILISDADKLYNISMDETLDEEIQDAAYNDLWYTIRKISEKLQIVTNGMIDEKTALRMAIHKREEIIKLLERVA